MRFERNFLLAFFAIAALLPLVVRDEYLLHIGILIMFSVIMATSFNLIVGYVGELPLGHVAFLGVGAYTAALLSQYVGGAMYITVPLGGVVAAIFGLVIGAITLRLRGPFFVIVTLAFAEVLRLITNNWVGLTNGPMGMAGIPKPELMAQATPWGQKVSFFYIGYVIAAIVTYAAFRFVYSNIGRAAIAVRENRFVAQSVGIWPMQLGLLTFVIAAGMIGLAGAFNAHYVSYVGPNVFGFSYMISMIIMVVLGGKGTLVGAVVGPVIVVLLEEYLRDLKEFRFSVFGLIVVAVIVFLPRGIMGFVTRRRESYVRE